MGEAVYSRPMTFDSFSEQTKRRVVVLLFDGVNALDVTGPVEAFSCAGTNGEALYSIETWAVDAKHVKTESGLTFVADKTLQSHKADVLLIPGGRGIRYAATLAKISHWLQSNHAKFDRIASVCTGAYVLAESGLLDGKTITTHWQYCVDLQTQYPSVNVQSDALFIREGKFYSSGGITAGIDLALDIIEDDFTAETAMAVARELVVFLRRSGAQAQYSVPLQAQSARSSTMAELSRWITNNLNADLSVERLAEQINLSPRQFTRRFKVEFGLAPAQFVKLLRLDTARVLLDQGSRYGEAALAVGFKSNDGFRRAFESRFGVSPIEYQKRFLATK